MGGAGRVLSGARGVAGGWRFLWTGARLGV